MRDGGWRGTVAEDVDGDGEVVNEVEDDEGKSAAEENSAKGCETELGEVETDEAERVGDEEDMKADMEENVGES